MRGNCPKVHVSNVVVAVLCLGMIEALAGCRLPSGAHEVGTTRKSEDGLGIVEDDHSGKLHVWEVYPLPPGAIVIDDKVIWPKDGSEMVPLLTAVAGENMSFKFFFLGWIDKHPIDEVRWSLCNAVADDAPGDLSISVTMSECQRYARWIGKPVASAWMLKAAKEVADLKAHIANDSDTGEKHGMTRVLGCHPDEECIVVTNSAEWCQGRRAAPEDELRIMLWDMNPPMCGFPTTGQVASFRCAIEMSR